VTIFLMRRRRIVGGKGDRGAEENQAHRCDRQIARRCDRWSVWSLFRPPICPALSSKTVQARTQATTGESIRRSRYIRCCHSESLPPQRVRGRDDMPDPRTRHTRVMIRARVDRSPPIRRGSLSRDQPHPARDNERSGLRTMITERAKWSVGMRRHPSVEGRIHVQPVALPSMSTGGSFPNERTSGMSEPRWIRRSPIMERGAACRFRAEPCREGR